MKKGKVIPLRPRKRARSDTSAEATDYARQWFDLSGNVQVMYAQGLKDGFVKGCLDANKTFIHIHEDLLPANKAIEVKAIDAACLDAGVLARRMNRLYLEGKNRILPFDVICAAAMELLGGTPPKEVGQHLASLRRIFTESPGPSH